MSEDQADCCTATSGLGIENYGVETELLAALQQLMLGDLTAMERAWVDGYRQGKRDGLQEEG